MNKIALLSVYNKTNILKFAQELTKLNYKIISSGGTAKHLKENNIEVLEVSQFTNFPEILEGRVKTIHPFIAAGILAKRDKDSHIKDLEKLNLKLIDIVVVNLYPFEEVIKKISDKIITEEVIENIDIGGVTLLRAAAKNFHHVLVVCDPQDYDSVIEKLKNNDVSLEFRKKLATKTFIYTAYYDALIADHFNEELFPEKLPLPIKKKTTLRYGENPHQKAILYKTYSRGLPDAIIHQGKELSFNNYLDLNSAYEIVNDFEEPTCAIIKHNNPCGVAIGKNLLEAYKLALSCDPVSAFGGIVGFNKEVDKETANELIKIFIECIIAPKYSQETLNIFSSKKDLRVIEFLNKKIENIEFKYILGGLLVQEKDKVDFFKHEVVTERKPTKEELESLIFAFKIAKYVKSNAIVLAQGKKTVGIGAGQMSRIDSLKIASLKMKKTEGLPLVLASDAFFPFPDVVEESAKIGISAIIQPGGSLKDKDSIDMANKYNIAMVFTGTRHFKH